MGIEDKYRSLSVLSLRHSRLAFRSQRTQSNSRLISSTRLWDSIPDAPHKRNSFPMFASLSLTPCSIVVKVWSWKQVCEARTDLEGRYGYQDHHTPLKGRHTEELINQYMLPSPGEFYIIMCNNVRYVAPNYIRILSYGLWKAFSLPVSPPVCTRLVCSIAALVQLSY